MYKKYIGKIYDKEVYIVDGSELRKKKQFADFLDSAMHGTQWRQTLAGVPENEIWIADEIDDDEKKAEIAGFWKYLKLLNKGTDPESAYKLSRSSENRVREKYNTFTRDDIEIKTLATIKGITIKLVNGKAVRNLIHTDFVQGGHDKFYKYIPEKTIWIDNTLNKNEYVPVIMHEYVERFLMKSGHSYNVAHEIATKIEYGDKK